MHISFLDMYDHRVLHYDFENMTTNRIFDVSGNGNYATMNNKHIQKREGICGSGLWFNSSPLFYEASANVTRKKLTKRELTVAAWIYLNEVNCKLYCKMHVG